MYLWTRLDGYVEILEIAVFLKIYSCFRKIQNNQIK